MWRSQINAEVAAKHTTLRDSGGPLRGGASRGCGLLRLVPWSVATDGVGQRLFTA
jgi:hypothetical protein